MNPSYFRINLPKEQAIQRLCEWNGAQYKERIETEYGDCIDVSLNDDDTWKGDCLYVYENDGWTVFEDLSGGYSFIPVDAWKEFAVNDELIVAGYNDAILFGELIVIKQGAVCKDFLEYMEDPEDNVNLGDEYTEIESWVNVASFVDDDEYFCSDEGTVLIF